MALSGRCLAPRWRGSRGLPGSLSPHKKLAPCENVGQIMSETVASGAPPAVSVVVPVRNEAGNIASLVAEIAAALGNDTRFEVIYVNDGSSDRTEAELIGLMASRPWLRQIKHRTSCGQAAAVAQRVCQ